MLLQILDMTQAAHWLVSVGREHNDLLDFIAKQNGFPTMQDVVATIDEASFKKEWNRFWQYTDEVNPYVSKHMEYVPVVKRRSFAESMQLLLY